MKWHWLRQDFIVAVHNELIAEHGGMPGIRDTGLLLSALSRPPNHSAYGKPSVFDLAAAYAGGIIKNHSFVDGNKRTGFIAACVFLNLNGWELIASEAESVEIILALATGDLVEYEFSAWIKDNSVTVRPWN